MLKILSGGLADRLARKKPLVVAGYGLSSLVRPMVAFATAPAHVLAVRLVDRVGKGVRGAPRDALVALVTPASDRGRAFGFQRPASSGGPVPLDRAFLRYLGVLALFTLGAGAALAGVAAVLLFALVGEGTVLRRG